MSIDEAIQKARYVADEHSDCWRNCENLEKCCKECEYEHEQLAQWLEELKSVRNLDKTNFSDGYNRGIDDFLKEADATFPMQSDGTAVLRRLENIADRLKGGIYSE